MSEWRSFDVPPNRCFHLILFLLLPISQLRSLMEFFLKDSMMVMEIVPLFEAKTKPLKRKLQHKTNEIAWKPKSREERHVSRGKRGLPRSRHPPRADHCRPPRPSRGSYCPTLLLVSRMQHFGSRLGLRFLLWIRRVRSTGPLLLVFLNPFGFSLILLC